MHNIRHRLLILKMRLNNINLELRAFFYWLISVLTFYLNPLFLLIKKPTIAEMITGTRMISTISKKR